MSMDKVKSSRPIGEYVPPFNLPKTKAEFDALGYRERCVIYQENPRLYEKFAHPKEKKPWED